MLGALKFNSAKCETTCRLCLGRIKLLKNKRNMQMRQYRKDIAELLRTGKQDYARIRVEAVIREQLTLTAYEILELYLELLAVRSSLVANSKEIPRDMVEALSSVLYAASRVPDLPELTTLHKMFMQKYGKEYVAEACSDVTCTRWMVNENLRHCLTIEPPEPALKLETLSEIAQEFGVEWDMDRARRDLLGDGDHMMQLPAAAAAATGGGGGGGGPLPPMGSGPIPGSSVMYQQHQQPIQMPMPSQQQQPAAAAGGGYADVAAAAAAAAAAAQQARSAAEAAARFANAVGGPHTPPRGGDGDGSNHNGGGGGGGAMLGLGTSSGHPLEGWLASVGGSSGTNTPPPAAAAVGRPLQMQPLPGSPVHGAASAAGPAAAAAKPGGYRIPSSEEVQRAYDTAQGPPPKPTAAAAAGPGSSAGPPAAAGGSAPASAAAGGGASENIPNGDGAPQDGDLSLPGVPHVGGDGGGVSGSSTLSEYDELQKRFEALKKS